MTGVHAALVVAFAILGPSPALAQARAVTFEEMRRALSPGDLISVVQTKGDSITGRLRRIGDTDLDLQPATPGSPTPLKIPLSAIQSLERPRDSSRNGALIGAAIGGGFWLAMFAYAAAVDFNEIDEWAGVYVAAGAISGGIGALAGWAIDRAHSKTHIRFDARPGTLSFRVVPRVSRGWGMTMVLSF